MSEQTASPANVGDRRSTATERQEQLVRQVVKLTESVQALARRTTAEAEPPSSPPTAGVTRVEFAYAMLGQFLGRGFDLPTVEVTRKVEEEGNTGTLTFAVLNGGNAARVLARDGTVDLVEGLVEGEAADTKILNDVPINIIVVITRPDDIPRAISLCPADPHTIE